MTLVNDILSFKYSNEAFETILKATLLLVLSVSGNFLAETLGCQSQKLLGNMIVKHVLILFMIYFTIDFTQRDQDTINPFINVFKAICVWILFHLFTHMNIIPTFIVGLLLMILFFISNYRHYIDNKKKKSTTDLKNLESMDNTLKLTQELIFVTMFIIILVGCSIYYFEKKREYKTDFKTWKFIFGVKKCKDYTPKSAKIW
tara:strand:+ start:250 stop:855 length:606 start_codon:yes stop_codon:yes gene_type:complete